MKCLFLSLLIFFLLILPSRADELSDISRTDSPFAGLIHQLPPSKTADIPSDGIYYSDHFVQMQNSGLDALVCRLHLFRNVQRTLDIMTYIWNEDTSGRFMMREAVRAAERGVKVRILIDTIGTPEDIAMMVYFAAAHPNLQLKIYNPVSGRVLPSKFHLYRELIFKFKKFNQRMHTKLILADGEIAITGGRNFGDEYFDLNDRHNFKDRDILVIGPMLKEMGKSFEDFWNHERSAATENLIDVRKAAAGGSPDPQRFYNFGEMFDDIERKAEDQDYIRKKFVETVFPVDRLMMIADPPGKKVRKTFRHVDSRATRQTLSVLSTIKHSIILQSPYFVLGGREVLKIRRYKKENPDVDIVFSTNSLAGTDSIYAYTYAFKRYKTYVHDLGVRIFELKPVRTSLYTQYYLDGTDVQDKGYGPYLSAAGLENDDYYGSKTEKHMSVHAKSFVIDDRIGCIGSMNLDLRSMHWNTEIGIVVWNDDFAKALKKDMLWDISSMNSWAIAERRDRRSFLRRMSEPVGAIMEHLPVFDLWPVHYTSAFELKKDHEPVAMDDPAFYDRYEDVGSFPLLHPLDERRWNLRILKPLIGSVQPVL